MHEAVLGTVLLVGSAIVYLAGLLTVYQTLLNKCGTIITDSNVLAGVKDFSKVSVSYLLAPLCLLFCFTAFVMHESGIQLSRRMYVSVGVGMASASLCRLWKGNSCYRRF